MLASLYLEDQDTGLETVDGLSDGVADKKTETHRAC